MTRDPVRDKDDRDDQGSVPGGSDPISDEEMADLDRPLHEVLGIELNFAPDDLAPPVDADRLLAFTRNQLSADEREEVLQLIASFRPWLDGWAQAMRRHMRED